MLIGHNRGQLNQAEAWALDAKFLYLLNLKELHIFVNFLTINWTGLHWCGETSKDNLTEIVARLLKTI